MIECEKIFCAHNCGECYAYKALLIVRDFQNFYVTKFAISEWLVLTLVHLASFLSLYYWVINDLCFCLVTMILFPLWRVSCIKILEIGKKKFEHFTRVILSPHVHEVYFCNKSVLLYNFVIDCFPMSRIVFEIHILTPVLVARRRCKQSHRKSHDHFTPSKYYFYYYSYRHSKVKGA